MTDYPDIVQRIVIEGDNEAKRKFADVGAAGDRAFAGWSDLFSRIGKQYSELSSRIEATNKLFKQQQNEIKGTAKSVQNYQYYTEKNFTRTIDVIRDAASQYRELTSRIAAVNTLYRQNSGAAALFTSGTDTAATATRKFSDTILNMGASLAAATPRLRDVSRDLGAFGRLAGMANISRFTESTSRLSRSVSAFVFPAITAGLGLLSKSFGDTADQITRTAGQLGTTRAAFQDFVGVGIAAGASTQTATRALETLTKQLKQADDNTRRNNKVFSELSNKINDARENVDEAVNGFANLNTTYNNLNLAVQDGKISFDEYDQKLIELRASYVAQEKAVAAAEKAQRAAEKALRDARDEAARTATAWEKLGVAQRDASGKLRDATKALPELADAFQRLAPGVERNKLAYELFGQAAAKYLPYLSKGAAGIRELEQASSRLTPSLTEAELTVGEKLSTAFNQFIEVITNLKDKIGAAISPAFIQFFSDLTEILISARPALTDLAASLGNVLQPIFAGIGKFVQSVLAPAFSALGSAAEWLAQKINSIFNTSLTSASIFAGVLGALVVAFGGMTTAVLLAVAAIGWLADALGRVNWTAWGQSAGVVITQITQWFTSLWEAIATGASQTIDYLTGVWAFLVDSTNNTVNSVTAFFVNMWNAIKSAWTAGIASIKATFTEWYDYIISSLNTVIEKFRQLFGMQSQANAAPSTARAQGGPVWGAGTSTSDSILARLSNGEYVIRAAAVRRYGAQLFNALNNMRVSPTDLAGFAAGGFVGEFRPVLRFAAGGPVSAGDSRPVNLILGDQSFPMRAGSSTIADLQRLAVRRATTSAGRKPGWYGGGK